MDEKEEMYPIQDGPDITLSQARKAHEGYVLLFGDIQSLERLKQRGGFGKEEAEMLIYIAEGDYEGLGYTERRELADKRWAEFYDKKD